MTAYILKTVLCSALLLLFYFLFLEREKMHRFNRAYLLFSIALSFTIPLISINTTVTQNLLPLEQLINVPENNLQEAITQQTTVATGQQSYLPIFLWGIYLSVTIFLLSRLLKNIYKILYKIKNNKSVPYYSAQLVLTTDNVIPHSFLQYIFIDKDGFERSAIEKEILSHELTHVRQKHSLDILFLELLLILCWFNPFLYLYRRAVRLNHEFLADDAVIKKFNDTPAYQYLLLEKSSQAGSLSLTSQFNYLLTKKRLIMMTRATSNKVAVLKQLAILPLLIVALFLFSTKVFAQKTKSSSPSQPITAGKNNAPQSVLQEYNSILDKYDLGMPEGRAHFFEVVTIIDRDRLEILYKKMSGKQQLEQTVGFLDKPKTVAPTKKQLDFWKNAATYQVRIDDKIVDNASLQNYSAEDFSSVFIANLAKTNKLYGQYYFQVMLETKSYHKLAANNNDNRSTIIFIKVKNPDKQ